MIRQPAIPKHVLPNFMECEICKRNITSANHYCHDCHLIFCDSCVVKEKEDVQVCSECGMNFFATDEKTGDLFCRQCKEEGIDNARIVSVQREKMVCPKCHSPNTSEIDDLKASLKERYKNIVIDSRNVLDDFSNYTSLLSTAKQKLMKLRLELPIMLHEPNLEQDMLGLIEEGTLIERRIMNRIHNFFLFLRSKKPYFFDGKTWMNEDVAILETYINQLQSDFMSFTAQVSESFNQPLELLQSLKERMEFLLTIKECFIKFMNKGVVTLEKMEYPVIHIEDVKMESDDDEQKGHGHVLLTSKYFKFIKSQGYLKKSDALLFSFPVNKLLSTDVAGRIFKRMTVQFQGINLKFNMDKEKMQQLAKYFDQLLDFETENKLDQDKIQRIKAFDVNSIFKIKAYIEENINALLNPGDVSYPPVPGMQARAQATPFPAGTGISTASSGMELETGMDFPGDDGYGHGMYGTGTKQAQNPLDMQGIYMQQDVQRPGNECTFADGYPRACYPSDMHPFAGLPPTNPQPEPTWRTFEIPPPMAVNNGCMPTFDSRQAQVQQVIDQPCPQYPQPEPRYAGSPYGCRPAMNPYGMPDPGGVAPSTYPQQGMGTWSASQPGGQNAYQQQYMQAKLQKAQEIRVLVGQLQTIEQRMISVKETMRNLEIKFETGKIPASVYFSTHQLFSEKMIALNQEGQELRQRLNSMQVASRGPQY
ncbi:MAG: hypothetical protein GYA24_06170 [Candidatus Lokiarchaeota archaeon]|nr:hypothetical protein [Candidatus Lokiarchaeota archaeon]